MRANWMSTSLPAPYSAVTLTVRHQSAFDGELLRRRKPPGHVRPTISAAFAPEPWPFLRRLLASPNVRVEFQPFAAIPRVATFNAVGLELQITTLESACPPVVERTVDNESEVFVEDAVDEKPEVLSGPQIAYPDLLRQAGIQGRVVVQAIIDTSGRAEPLS